MDNNNGQTEAAIVSAKSLLYETLKSDMSTIEHSLNVYMLTYHFYWKLPAYLKRKLNKENLLCAALLHDVGKGLIHDEILKKSCDLDQTEREIMKTHAVKGKMMLQQTRFKHIADWVCYHHERVDGTGYYGLTHKQTPLAAQIIAVADTYSALTLDRVYRKHCSTNEAIKVLNDVSGTQLDRTLVNIFCGIANKPDTVKKRKN